MLFKLMVGKTNFVASRLLHESTGGPFPFHRPTPASIIQLRAGCLHQSSPPLIRYSISTQEASNILGGKPACEPSASRRSPPPMGTDDSEKSRSH
ncbi:hypothetical protein EVAR_725_1 [Eumeta japonica]|uniref:Uncharacterized protein n=1 Tax=Eumeta variegata TaxID=151549 RepID=A0A4C1SEI4_EUMVA|nr:hypothetical protein EVAR_725_1 [Eumeta japonica]